MFKEREGAGMKKLWSIFTDDMEHCFYTGSTDIERHHVFNSYNRNRSEKYGFVIPLRRDLHPNGVMADDNWQNLDLHLKQECQKHYEKYIGTRYEFMKEFGRNWLDD